MHKKDRLSGCVALCLASQLLAQAPLEQDFLVPLHEKDTQLWAAGPNYKASFDDGFTFLPRLGATSKRNRPLRLTTTSIRVGEREFAEPMSTTRRVSTHRCERQHGSGIVEAYDVRVDGIEQTFVLATRPTTSGPLVIECRVETDMWCAVREAAHAPLEFALSAGGNAAVTYGEATAIDATGRRTPMVTSFDGANIHLHLDANTLADAAYPLVVDPLTSTATLSTQVFAPVTSTAIASSTASTDVRVMTCFSRVFTGSDQDVFALLSDLDGSNVALVFSDVTSLTTENVTCCYSGGDGRFLLGYEQSSAFGGTSIGLYSHFAGSDVPFSGIVTSILSTTGPLLNPQLGGSRFALRSLLVYDQQVGTTFNSRGTLLTSSTLTIVTSANLGVSGNPQETTPSVNPLSQTSDSWRWVATQWSPSAAVRGGVFRFDGTLIGNSIVLQATSIPRNPKVAGSNERYMVSATTNLLSLQQLRARRVDWPEVGALSLGDLRTVDSALSPNTITNRDLAYNYGTRSHWAIAYEVDEGFAGSNARVKRLGYSGGTVETQDLHPMTDRPGFPAVAIARPNFTGEFPIAFATEEAANPVYYRSLQYSPNAVSALIQNSCATGISGSGVRPWAGSEFFLQRLSGLPIGTPVVFFLSFGPAAIDLSSIGMPGCIYGVDPTLEIATLPSTVGLNGFAEVEFPLQDFPVFIGNLYSQWAWLSPGANPLGVVTAGSVEHRVE